MKVRWRKGAVYMVFGEDETKLTPEEAATLGSALTQAAHFALPVLHYSQPCSIQIEEKKPDAS